MLHQPNNHYQVTMCKLMFLFILFYFNGLKFFLHFLMFSNKRRSKVVVSFFLCKSHCGRHLGFKDSVQYLHLAMLLSLCWALNLWLFSLSHKKSFIICYSLKPYVFLYLVFWVFVLLTLYFDCVVHLLYFFMGIHFYGYSVTTSGSVQNGCSLTREPESPRVCKFGV